MWWYARGFNLRCSFRFLPPVWCTIMLTSGQAILGYIYSFAFEIDTGWCTRIFKGIGMRKTNCGCAPDWGSNKFCVTLVADTGSKPTQQSTRKGLKYNCVTQIKCTIISPTYNNSNWDSFSLHLVFIFCICCFFFWLVLIWMSVDNMWYSRIQRPSTVPTNRSYTNKLRSCCISLMKFFINGKVLSQQRPSTVPTKRSYTS